ncbi:MAG: HTH domain-containing protein [Bacteroidales bacterium]|nr:HTH domain-containing protein [Bacteroidales bacterium]
MFTVTFYRPNSKKNLELSLTQKKIVELMIKTPSITTMQIAEQLHIGRTTVNKELKTLREFGVIKHIGQRNNGEWVVDL